MRNLGHGLLPHGSPEREHMVRAVLGLVMIALDAEDQDGPFALAALQEGGGLACRAIGYSAPHLCRRIVEIRDEPERSAAFSDAFLDLIDGPQRSQS